MARRKHTNIIHIEAMIDNWKNKEVFEKQLELNKKQLSNYPEHWNDFQEALEVINPSSILDIGCGCGTYCNLVKSIDYIGADYSAEAIVIARDAWPNVSFIQLDFWDLTSEFCNNFDVLHFGAILDIFEDADKALEFILKLDHKAFIIGRVATTTDESYKREYKAYNIIDTTQFYHNYDNFINIILSYNYSYRIFNNTFLITKNK